MAKAPDSDGQGAPDTRPMVSVVVPSYNRSKSLLQCLESLAVQELNSKDYEVIVVDDGSTDDTATVVRKFTRSMGVSARYYKVAHGGPAAARNAGVRKAKGQIVAFIDDDCVADPAWLEQLLKPFSSEDIAGVEGRVLPVGADDPLATVVANESGGQYLTANVAYLKHIFEAIGGFDEAFPYPSAEDYDLAWRCLEAGFRIAYAPSATVRHPVRQESTSQFLRKLPHWKSIIYLSEKHPEAFFLRNQWGIKRHLLFYALGFPIVKLKRHLGSLLRHPDQLLHWCLRMVANSAYCTYLLLKLVTTGPRAWSSFAVRSDE